MKLDLTPEQAFFAGTTRQFLDDKVPTSLLRGDPAGFGRDFWRQGADLGWTSLLVPETDGGGSGVFDEADLVVVGFGGAGAACAIAAADHGASVIVLEKQPEDRHTPSTYMSGGIVMAVNDVDRAALYMDRCSANGGNLSESVCFGRIAAEHALA
jgi:alkylation response protein AidB-like acyl-CoA dehydrogenase